MYLMYKLKLYHYYKIKANLHINEMDVFGFSYIEN